MGSHSVVCHPAEVRIPHLPPAEAGTQGIRFIYLGGMQGWVESGKADRLGIEPATSQSQVQRFTAAPPRNNVLPVLWMTSCFHIIRQIEQNQARHYVSKSSPCGGTGSDVGVQGNLAKGRIAVHLVTLRFRSWFLSRPNRPTWFLRPSHSHKSDPKRHLDQISRFCTAHLYNVPNTQTDRKTTLRAISVAVGHYAAP